MASDGKRSKAKVRVSEVRDVTSDGEKLSAEARRFIDPADRRLEIDIILAPHPYADFFRAWLIMGIDDQRDVKCLLPIESKIRYTARTHGGASLVHGSCLSIYDAIQLLPIDQRLETGTRFSIDVPMVEPPYARAIFSDSITPIDRLPATFEAGKPATAAAKRPSAIPFNRRNLLLCVEPGETLSMQLRVGYAPSFSIRERTYWWLISGERAGASAEIGLTVGTQLGRDPIAYLHTIISQLNSRIGETENNRFDFMLRRAGFSADQRESVLAYVTGVSDELMALSR